MLFVIDEGVTRCDLCPKPRGVVNSLPIQLISSVYLALACIQANNAPPPTPSMYNEPMPAASTAAFV